MKIMQIGRRDNNVIITFPNEAAAEDFYWALNGDAHEKGYWFKAEDEFERSQSIHNIPPETNPQKCCPNYHKHNEIRMGFQCISCGWTA